MKSILELREVERIIELVASKYKIDGSDFEDLVQIGRIAVWELTQRITITEKNVNEYKGLVYTHVNNVLVNEHKKANAQKRIQLSKIKSLDEPVSSRSDDERMISDFIPSTYYDDPLEATVKNIDSKLFFNRLVKKSLKERTTESKRAVMWLIVHEMGIERHEIPKKICYQVFVDKGITHWLWIFFNNSPFRAINYAYPGEFPLYKMRAPQRYWNGRQGRKRAIQALKDVLKETGYEPAQYPSLLNNQFFEEFKLACPLGILFNWNRFDFLNATFPGKYHPWEFSMTQRLTFKSYENIKKAVKWLVEEKLGYKMDNLSVDEVWNQGIATRITKKTFSEYGLRAIIAKYKSPEPVLRLVYPDKFLDWSFQTKGKWSGEKGRTLAARATRWLVEEYLEVNPKEVTHDLLCKHGLKGMISAKSLGFNSSPKKVMRNAYPHLEF